MTRQEAAEYAAVHLNSVKLWEKKGLLRTTKTGSKGQETVWVDKGQLDKLLENRKPRGPKPGIARYQTRIAALEAENRVLQSQVTFLRELLRTVTQLS